MTCNVGPLFLIECFHFVTSVQLCYVVINDFVTRRQAQKAPEGNEYHGIEHLNFCSGFDKKKSESEENIFFNSRK